VLSQGKLITAQHIALDSPVTSDNLYNLSQRIRVRTPLDTILREVERLALEIAINQARGDREEAARMLGLSAENLELEFRELDTKRFAALSSAAGQE